MCILPLESIYPFIYVCMLFNMVQRMGYEIFIPFAALEVNRLHLQPNKYVDRYTTSKCVLRWRCCARVGEVGQNKIELR